MTTEKLPRTERKCGLNCFRYFPQNRNKRGQVYNCQVGLVHGKVIVLGQDCIWEQILPDCFDPGTARTGVESRLFSQVSRSSSPENPELLARQALDQYPGPTDLELQQMADRTLGLDSNYPRPGF